MMETEQLANLIAQKRELLARIWQLTERQCGLLGDSDLTPLLSLLAAKQALLAQLQELERHLDPFREQDPEQRRWASSEARARVRQWALDCEQLLENIVRVERACESQLIHRREDTSQKLQGAHHAAHARAEYLDTPKSSSSRREGLDNLA